MKCACIFCMTSMAWASSWVMRLTLKENRFLVFFLVSCYVTLLLTACVLHSLPSRTVFRVRWNMICRTYVSWWLLQWFACCSSCFCLNQDVYTDNKIRVHIRLPLSLSSCLIWNDACISNSWDDNTFTCHRRSADNESLSTGRLQECLFSSDWSTTKMIDRTGKTARPRLASTWFWNYGRM
jgi:hypothetical protein